MNEADKQNLIYNEKRVDFLQTIIINLCKNIRYTNIAIGILMIILGITLFIISEIK